jgi:cytochrome P450
MMNVPADPVAAATHADPYPYYAELVAQRPLHRDDRLSLWVAASAEAVGAVLQSRLCRVRPLAEPVPRALVGSPAGLVFRHLVRMTDGPGHCPLKGAVSASLARLTPGQVAAAATEWAEVLTAELAQGFAKERLQDYAFRLPVYAVASLLGVARGELPRIAAWMADFVGCLSPLSSPAQVERGKEAAGHLFQAFQALLTTEPAGLLAALAQEVRRAGIDDPEVIVANGIGFLSQGYEATAGLIGNALVALATQQAMRDEVLSQPALVRELIQEVLRHDPPVQNTRRFVAESGRVAGQDMQAGDAILVVLAAANRDPAVNPNPERFDLHRASRQVFTLGTGSHACPGGNLAATVAQAGVARLIASGLPLFDLAEKRTYRASVNTRIPVFVGGTR